MAPRKARSDTVSTEVAAKAEAPVAKGQTVGAMLSDPGTKKELNRVAAANYDPDQLLRLTLTQIRHNSQLAKASVASLGGAMLASAELGLYPGVLGHVYYVPFRNSKTGTIEVTFIPGYKGLLELVRRSGLVSSIYAQVVHEEDKFEIEFGTNQGLRHVKALTKAGPVVGAYAFCKMKDGTEQYDFMNMDEIEAIRKRSKAASNGPWVTDWEEMAKKTVLRRLVKTLPLSINDQRITSIDNAVIRNQGAGTLDVADIEFEDEVIDVDTGEIKKVDTSPALTDLAEKAAEQSKPEPVEDAEPVEEESTKQGFKTPLMEEE